MREHYDFSELEEIKPRQQRINKVQITMRLDPEVLSYFKSLGDEYAMPYQTLINSYLKDCVEKNKKPQTKWVKQTA